MLAGQLVSAPVSILHLQDPVSRALEEMDIHDLSHLPVIHDGKYVGLVSEEEAMSWDEKSNLEEHQRLLLPIATGLNDHFLVATHLARQHDLPLVPVLGEQGELEGVILLEDLFRQMADFSGSAENGSLLVLVMEKTDYSLGEINRLVESNDAFITQINTWTDPVSQLLWVTIRINKMEVSDIVSTFQRHEYTVQYYFGDELYRNELQSNLENLMNYLNL